MPQRKKLFETDAAASPSSPVAPSEIEESSAPAPRATARGRKKLTEEAPAEAAPAKPAPKRRAKAVVEEAPAEKPAPKRKAKAEPKQEEPAPAAAAPSRGLFGRPKPEAPAPEPAAEKPAAEAPKPRMRRKIEDEPADEAPKPRMRRKIEDEPAEEVLKPRMRRKIDDDPADEAPKPRMRRKIEDEPADEAPKPRMRRKIEDEPADEAPKPRMRRKAAAEDDDESEEHQDEVIILAPRFRTIQPMTAPAPAAFAEAEPAEEDEEEFIEVEAFDIDQDDDAFGVLLAPAWRGKDAPVRESRRGRGRGRRPIIEDAAPVDAPEPEAPAAPAPAPRRELVVVPPSAPQVIRHDGHAVLIVNGRVVPAMVCDGSISTDRGRSAFLEQARLAAEHGVELFRFGVEISDREASAKIAIDQIKDFLKMASDLGENARFLVRAKIFAVAGAEGYEASQSPEGAEPNIKPSICDEEFWGRIDEEIAALAEGAVKQCPSVIGIHLSYDSWVHPEGAAFDRSPAATEGFRKWLSDRYSRDVVSLRASWFDGAVDFEGAEIPPEEGLSDEAGFVRTQRKSRRWVDYNLFLSDVTSQRVAGLCYTVNSRSEGRLMAGTDYGWTMEWSHPTSGHLALGKLLRCPDVDFLSGPPSEESRGPGGIGAFPTPIDSCTLNGKLHLCEQAYPTSISGGAGEEHGPVIKTPQALEAVHWRDAGSILSHGGGVVWSDVGGQGWLASRGIWERAKQVRQALQWKLSTPQVAPDAAILIDERSLAYLADERAFVTLIDSVQEAVMRSGLSAGFYLLSDLAHRENFPDCKVVIFVNAWDMRPEVRSAIKTRLQRDGKVLTWLYCAGLFEAGRESLERVREATGIALRLQPFNAKPGTNLLNLRDPLSRSLDAEAMRKGGGLEPSFFAIPEDASVLGEYAGTGLPSFVVKRVQEGPPEEHWTSVFLGEPIVSPGFIRALGEMANAHIWDHDDDVIHVRPPFLAVHCSGAGNRTITLPDKWSAYSVQAQDWAPVEGNTLRFLAMDGSTHVFLVGHRSEIEALMASPETMNLTEEEILARKDDTVHWDSMQLEVPIMKLEEWVEESWGEELSDDLLLKPSMLEAELESVEPEPKGAPRKRRRGGERTQRGRRRGGEKGEQPSSPSGDGLGFNFRRR